MMPQMQDRVESRMVMQWFCWPEAGVPEVFIDFSACLVAYIPFIGGECAGTLLKCLSLLRPVENCLN